MRRQALTHDWRAALRRSHHWPPPSLGCGREVPEWVSPSLEGGGEFTSLASAWSARRGWKLHSSPTMIHLVSRPVGRQVYFINVHRLDWAPLHIPSGMMCDGLSCRGEEWGRERGIRCQGNITYMQIGRSHDTAAADIFLCFFSLLHFTQRRDINNLFQLILQQHKHRWFVQSGLWQQMAPSAF